VLHDDRVLRRYYDRRAPEYETIYRRQDPLRQKELAELTEAVQRTLADRRVLEIACGTGYWTEVAARVAGKIVAIDVSERMLSLARRKDLSTNQVTFLHGDAYDLGSVPGSFDAGLANFWLSHIPRIRLEEFLAGFHRRLGTGAVVFMADNSYIPWTGGQLVTRAGGDDTFKTRRLADGSEHPVLKNYYDAEELREILAPWVAAPEIHVGTYYWWVIYTAS
jgi:ubiquinone/menaquinone biosynthesis C-methylase UbiE